MKPKILAALGAVAAILFCGNADAQTYETNNPVVQIFAGSGVAAYLEGQGTQAMFNSPSAIVADSSSNLFVLDAQNSRVRKIAPDATVSTFVGGGSVNPPGFGAGVTLSGFAFGLMAIDRSNTIWVTTTWNGAGGLLRIGSDSSVQFLSYSGVSYESGVCVDSGNNIYFSSYSGNRIYRLAATGTLTVFAGNGSTGAVDDNGIFASFRQPAALAADAADNVYVWDSGNRSIRRIDQNQNVTTIAGNGFSSDSDAVGTNASFSWVYAMTVDDFGNVILACGSSIRKMSATANVTTVAGSFSQNSYANGAGALARFSGARGVCLSQGMIFVADTGNQRVRQITFNPLPQPVSGANLLLNTYPGLIITGVVGRTYQIQLSADASNWNPAATVLLTRSPYLWIDTNSVTGKKFYRAYLLP